MPQELEDIFAAALAKYREGAGKYGRYEPLTDRRDMIREAEAEILDAINYLAMLLMKIKAETGR